MIRLRGYAALTLMWALIALILAAGYAIGADRVGTSRLSNVPVHQQAPTPEGSP